MAYTLVGSRYIGSGSQPTPVVGYDLVDTSTGNMYVSNSSSTAWVQVGNVNYTNLGQLPLTGGTMTGAISGASGWAPNDSPNFTTTAKLGGLTLATQADLANATTSILNGIAPKITSAISSSSSAISVKANIALASGFLFFGNASSSPQYVDPSPQTIPLPVYPDGSTAIESDCKWFVGLAGTSNPSVDITAWVQGWPCGVADSSGDIGLLYSANPLTNRTFFATLKARSSGARYATTISYLIIGIKS